MVSMYMCCHTWPSSGRLSLGHQWPDTHRPAVAAATTGPVVVPRLGFQKYSPLLGQWWPKFAAYVINGRCEILHRPDGDQRNHNTHLLLRHKSLYNSVSDYSGLKLNSNLKMASFFFTQPVYKNMLSGIIIIIPCVSSEGGEGWVGGAEVSDSGG